MHQNRIDQIRQIHETLNTCNRCGAQPEFRSDKRTYGHGDYPTCHWVECACGMATKELPEGYDGTFVEVIAKLRAIWNG